MTCKNSEIFNKNPNLLNISKFSWERVYRLKLISDQLQHKILSEHLRLSEFLGNVEFFLNFSKKNFNKF